MPNKPQKSWLEIQMAIAAVSITATLGFWNVFAAPDRQQASLQAKQATLPPPPPTPTETAVPTQVPSPTSLPLVPVKIIFGGTPPKQQVIQVVAPPQESQKKKNGGNNSQGGGGSVSAPAPVTSTGSSKP